MSRDLKLNKSRADIANVIFLQIIIIIMIVYVSCRKYINTKIKYGFST